MKKTLDCPIVQDILPLYVENLTSEESNLAIRHHLEHCESCRNYYNDIKKPIETPKALDIEIDYMRKANHSFKRKNHIILGITTAFTLILFGIFLRLFIIGTPVLIDDLVPNFNYTWSYDWENNLFSLNGSLNEANTTIRIKVDKDDDNSQIKLKLYTVMPSIFYADNTFSVDIPWDGDYDIVWQGPDRQDYLMRSDYMHLFVTNYKNGQYEHIIDSFDWATASKIDALFKNATVVSDKKLPEFDKELNSYLIIVLPSYTGIYYSMWVDDVNNSDDIPSIDERIFLYREDGQYYLYQQNQPLKKITPDDVNQLFEYIKKTVSF